MSRHEPILPPDDAGLPAMMYLCDNCEDNFCPPEDIWWVDDVALWCCESCCHSLIGVGDVGDGISLADWLKRAKE